MKWITEYIGRPWIDIILTALSAAFLILTFPKSEMYYLAYVALVPLILIIKKSDPLKAFIYSLSAGLIFYTQFLWWLLSTEGVNPFNFTLGVFLKACYLGLFGLLACYFQKKEPRWNIITFPSTWVIIEFMRSHISFLSTPWGILGYSQYSVLPVVWISSFAGVYGISFLIVMVNTTIAEIIDAYLSSSQVEVQRRAYSPGIKKISLGLLTGILILSGLHALSYTQEGSTPKLKVALVQGNVYWNNKYWSNKYKNDTSYREGIFQKYSLLSRQVAGFKPDLILWPSSSVPGKMPYEQMRVRMLSELAQEMGSFLLVGSSGFDKFNPEQRQTWRLSNSAFLFSPQGKMLDKYDKIRLLPFDEYLPLRGFIKWPSWVASDMIDSLPGKHKTIFNMGDVRFAVLICWENMFPEQFREMAAKGVQFMVSMTNEGFTKVPVGHYQMLAVNVLRAVENHVAIARISSTGVSCIIEPNGRIVDRVRDHNSNDVNVEGYLVDEIPLSSKRTFYSRYGDWFIYTLSGIFIVFISKGRMSKLFTIRKNKNNFQGGIER
jgi:apolipoprotein N-acyltransferase